MSSAFCARLVAVALLAACGPRARPPATAADADKKPAETAEARSLREAHEGPASDVERIFKLAPTPPMPQRGTDTAKVTIEVWSDFQCPFCARLVPTLHELEENYGEFVRILWRDCPLPFHQHALPAAEAAHEVMVQAGSAAFWAFHDTLFAHQDSLDAPALVRMAGEVKGVDAARVQSALDDHRHVPHLMSEISAIQSSGAASQGIGTPASFINGRLISGAQDYQVFEDAVERALAETPEQRAEAVARSDAAYPMAKVRHILVQWKGSESADASIVRSKEDAKKRADEARAKAVKPGADFHALAREYSNCPSAPDGGELGRVTRGELVPEFESVLFTLTPGEVSGVVETPFGYHVIQRED